MFGRKKTLIYPLEYVKMVSTLISVFPFGGLMCKFLELWSLSYENVIFRSTTS